MFTFRTIFRYQVDLGKMLTPRQHKQDCQGPVHARFSKRRERRPGLRERHSAPPRVDKSEDENAKTETPRSAFVGHPHSGGISERYTLRVDQKRLPLGSKTVTNYEKVDEEFVSTQYKELTTIEAIRKQIATQPKLQTASPTLPDWLLNLDLNLDVTAVDIIPPFDSSKQNNSDTYRSEPKVTIIHEDDYNNNVSRTETSADGEHYSYNDVRENHEEKYREVDTRQVPSRQSNYSSYGRTSRGRQKSRLLTSLLQMFERKHGNTVMNTR